MFFRNGIRLGSGNIFATRRLIRGAYENAEQRMIKVVQFAGTHATTLSKRKTRRGG